ncbi:MAG: sensor domain-containing diguanylate cyclase [Polyangiaceae bacterium]
MSPSPVLPTSAFEELSPFPDFATAALGTLTFLQAHLGMGLWMLTRVSGDDWIVLETAKSNPAYDVRPGDVLRWSDSICARMVAGVGPAIAPDIAHVEVYRDAPIVADIPINAYVGFPICDREGGLLGTLCAVDPAAQAHLGEIEPLLRIAGKLLATVLNLELQATTEARRREIAEAEAMLDDMTGLWNHRAWSRFLAAEEERCRRYGHPACVLSIDLDGLKVANDTRGHAAGDALIRGVADALRESMRAHDVAARLGGDEFGALLIECVEEQARAVVQRVRAALTARGISASIGLAKRDPRADLADAQRRADTAMYADKAARKAGRA